MVNHAALATALTRHLDALDAAATPLPGVIAGLTTSEATIGPWSWGPRTVGEPEPIPADAVLALYSMTKSMTATVALQLADDGLLDLDAPAVDHLPEIGGVGVLDGFDDDGTPTLRAPRSPVTTRQLLTHTAGFGYTFFDEDCARAARAGQLPDVATATAASLRTPLMFDPGTRWEYGINIDWVGRVIEAVAGRRLGEVMTERLLQPLGMRDTTFARDDAQLARSATIHARRPDGSLTALRRPTADTPELDMGGQGLYSTVGDVLRFLRMWLNDGRSDDGRQILRPETVRAAALDQLGDLTVTPLRGADPRRTRDVEFFPGVRKGWSLIAMTNEDDAPTGRPANSLGWAGLANLYFWIDRRTGIAGIWATQLFPFGDRTALDAFVDFETAVYRSV